MERDVSLRKGMKLSKVSISSLVFVPPARVLSNQTNSYVKDPFKTAYPFVLEREILHNFASNVGEGRGEWRQHYKAARFRALESSLILNDGTHGTSRLHGFIRELV